MERYGNGNSHRNQNKKAIPGSIGMAAHNTNVNVHLGTQITSTDLQCLLRGSFNPVSNRTYCICGSTNVLSNKMVSITILDLNLLISTCYNEAIFRVS